jgi:hypothetical protein
MSKTLTLFPLIWDSTMLMEFDRCPISGFRKYIQHLNSGLESTDLIAGGALARGCEVTRKSFYNEGYSHEDSVLLGQEALAEFYGDHVPRFKSFKDKQTMVFCLGQYFKQYDMRTDLLQPLELKDGTLAIEYRMSLELPILHPVYGIPLTLVGRADLLGTYMGRNVLSDEKTTGAAFGEHWGEQWNTRGQFSTYCYLLEKAGIPVSGALIRGISITKAMKEAAELSEFAPELDYPRRDKDFIELYTNRSPWQVEVWGNQMLKKLQILADTYALWLESEDHPALHFNGIWNEGCVPFFKPCQFMELCRSKSEEQYIDSNFDQNIWLPHEHKRLPLVDYIARIEQGEV